MGKQGAQERSELVVAAERVDADLKKFEHDVAVACREPLNSQKQIARAAQALQDLGTADQQLGQGLKALVDAITMARQRQQSNVEAAVNRAHEVERRSQVLKDLLERYGDLGGVAMQLNQLALHISTQAKEATTPEQVAGLFVSLKDLQDQLAKAAEGAQLLVDASEAAEFTDVSREAESLRQQLLSSKNKLGLLHNSLNPS